MVREVRTLPNSESGHLCTRKTVSGLSLSEKLSSLLSCQHLLLYLKQAFQCTEWHTPKACSYITHQHSE